jgi:hypothetical protein
MSASEMILFPGMGKTVSILMFGEGWLEFLLRFLFNFKGELGK